MTKIPLSYVAICFLAVNAWSQADAQTANSDGFKSECNSRLQNIQVASRVCVLGVVNNDLTIKTLFSTNANYVGKNVPVFKIAPQEAELPTPPAELSNLKGRIIAIGGFDNGDSIYSARLI